MNAVQMSKKMKLMRTGLNRKLVAKTSVSLGRIWPVAHATQLAVIGSILVAGFSFPATASEIRGNLAKDMPSLSLATQLDARDDYCDAKERKQGYEACEIQSSTRLVESTEQDFPMSPKARDDQGGFSSPGSPPPNSSGGTR